MDVFEFRKQRNRICASSDNCSVCPLQFFTYCNNVFAITDNDEFAKLIETLETWAKEHPVLTRQSKFLKVYPDTYLDGNGNVDICPCVVDKNHRNEKGACAMPEINCLECKRDFWLKEVDDDE